MPHEASWVYSDTAKTYQFIYSVTLVKSCCTRVLILTDQPVPPKEGLQKITAETPHIFLLLVINLS